MTRRKPAPSPRDIAVAALLDVANQPTATADFAYLRGVLDTLTGQLPRKAPTQ